MKIWTDAESRQTVAYDEQGSGCPLVLLHAFPQCRRQWAPQLAGLADVARVIAPDLPGFGGSTRPESGWTVDTAADQLAAFLTGIGIAEPVVLGGLSMGGYVALAFARRHPDKLAGLILADTRAEPDSPEVKQNRDRTTDLALGSGTAAVFAGMLPKVLGTTTHASRPAVVAEAIRLAEAQPAETVAAALRALRDRPDARPDLPTITVPTLVIVGAEDTLTPPDVAKSLAAAIPNAALMLIPASGHLSNLETPDAFTDAIREFLTRCR